MNELTQQRREDLAWAAGFMDGEAHIGLVNANKKTGNKHLHIQICQTEDGPLQRIQSIFGVGKIYGPYDHNKTVNPNRRAYKQYHISAYTDIQTVIEAVWPWLSEPKRKQAQQAINGFEEYLKRPKVRRGSGLKPKVTIPSCHPEKGYAANGLCHSCYSRYLKQRKNDKQKS